MLECKKFFNFLFKFFFKSGLWPNYWKRELAYQEQLLKNNIQDVKNFYKN